MGDVAGEAMRFTVSPPISTDFLLNLLVMLAMLKRPLLVSGEESLRNGEVGFFIEEIESFLWSSSLFFIFCVDSKSC